MSLTNAAKLPGLLAGQIDTSIVQRQPTAAQGYIRGYSRRRWRTIYLTTVIFDCAVFLEVRTSSGEEVYVCFFSL